MQVSFLSHYSYMKILNVSRFFQNGEQEEVSTKSTGGKARCKKLATKATH